MFEDRSIDFNRHDEVPVSEFKQCIAPALTCHRNKKLESPDRWKMVERVTQQT